MTAADLPISEFHESPMPEGSPRFASVPAIPCKPSVVIGMRRAGKIYLMHQRMRELNAWAVDKRDLLYANFADDRLQPAAAVAWPVPNAPYSRPSTSSGCRRTQPSSASKRSPMSPACCVQISRSSSSETSS